jgi:hypothetical protein
MHRAASKNDVVSPRGNAWLAALCALVLVAWLFEFATHLHVPDRTDGAPHHIQHACTFCATFAVGAGPSDSALHVHFVAPTVARRDGRVVPPATIRIAAYRSRGPPSVDLN